MHAVKKTPSSAKGRLVIISAPSGTGKTTICNAILNRFPSLRYSISHTTREPRAGEKDGVDYFFVDVPRFKKMIAKQHLVEWAEVHGNYYGTAADFIDRQLKNGMSVLLDIDVQGAEQIARRYPDAIKIFIMPPSVAELARRLSARGADSQDVIEKRLKNAENEISRKDFYDHVIVNDQLTDAIDALHTILRQYI